MPELPEVETIVRTLSPQITGRRIARVHIPHAPSMRFGHAHLPEANGLLIRRVHRRAKLVLLDLAGDMRAAPARFLVAFHLKMTGSFFVHPAGSAPRKHTRIIFDLLSGAAQAPTAGKGDATASGATARRDEAAGGALPARLFFDDVRTFGYCRIMLPEEAEQWDFLQSLGPEPLETPPAALAERFGASKAAIKSVLLNQRVVAGIGNIYADESLFWAGVAPATSAASLSACRREKLAMTVRDVLRQSIEECGSSIRDYRDAFGNAGAFQNNFAVYGRGGQACVLCGGPLASARVAGRGTVYCPKCQKG